MHQFIVFVFSTAYHSLYLYVRYLFSVQLSLTGDLMEMCEQLKRREKLLKTVAAGQGITGNIFYNNFTCTVHKELSFLAGEIYEEILASFCELLQDPKQYSENKALTDTVENIRRGSMHVDSLFTHFINHAHKCYPLLYVLPQLKNMSDLTSPAQW